ncbi:efflux RND transporter periplasmic adaptor subunit [Loktanella sp. M215]|uniref:efflux RND transporter periplasmic adaptor subunit n=1 Tax=Loktanella sp. M215 TaxID=2675431 RepID=UPI001F02FB8A|nr:efflux RND transporter periplasmic adaptor subunit [Loktanella sp. M215]MCF7700846.1 efflux RND transporter periplasmic adaptor subunit [Loktanella sp. M215]
MTPTVFVRHIRRATVTGLILAICAVVQPVAVAAQEAASEAPASVTAPSVTVVPAQMTEVTQVVSASGGLLAREDVVVSARVSGAEIVSLLVEVGDTVKKGDTLAQLNDQTLTAQLQQADANRAAAEAAIAQAEGQVASATANATQTTSALDRSRQLRSDGAVSQSALDQAQAASDGANATVQSAQAAVAAAKAQLAQAEAARDIAALNLSWATVKAPVDGIIADRTARLGDLSNAGMAMFDMIRDGQIEAELEIVETDLVKVSVGDPVSIRVAGLPPRDGTVRRISPQVDPVSRLGTVRVSIVDQAGLRVGIFASADIRTAQRTALTLPVSAVTTSGGVSTVQKVVDGTVQQVEVQLGVVSAGLREITAGLSAGDTVLLRAGAFFRTGDKVTPVPPADRAAPAPAPNDQAAVEATE